MVAAAKPVVRSNLNTYWGTLTWRFGEAVECVTDALPDFTGEILVQQAMSAAGLSLPLHGFGVVGHGTGLYTRWHVSEGVLLTQPWLRRLLTATLQQQHLSSPHLQASVGIICLSRPTCILSNLSLTQAQWLSRHISVVQAGVEQCFAAAVEHGFVHLAADKPSSVALNIGVDSNFQVYLISWGICADRIRINWNSQKDVMRYLLGIPSGVVAAACQRFRWR
jgi:hypothetical protein